MIEAQSAMSTVDYRSSSEASEMRRHHSQQYFIMLDLMRFLSATLVMALHLGFWGWWEKGDEIGTLAMLFPQYPDYPELISFTWFGWVGVQIFFLISGLVIAMSAEKSTALPFLRSRFLRVYPAAWICATVSLVVVVAATRNLERWVILRYLNTLIISPYPAWIDGVYWTLVLELIFYGLVFLTLAAGRREHLHRLGILLGCASTLYIAGLVNDVVPGGWLFTLLLLRHGVFFACGMMIWYLGRTGGASSWCNIAFLILFSVMGAIEIVYTAVEKLDALNLSAPLWPPVVVWLAMSSCILASAIWSDAINRLMFPARDVLRVLGLATYPLYLIHQTVGGAMGAVSATIGIHRSIALLLAILTSVAASIAVAMLLEPCVRRFAATRFDLVADGLLSNKILFRRK